MDNTVIQNFKTYIQQFVEISDEQIVSFIKATTKVTYKKGDYFSIPDKPSSFMGLVIKGLFRAYVFDKENREVILDFMGENNIVSSFGGIILNQFIPIYIQALEDSDIYIISRDDFIKLWENDTKWKEFLQKQAESVSLVSRQRYISLLVDDAKTRYLKFLNDYKPFENRIKLGYIASYLGITSETLSRIRSSPL